jgi:uncharacterized membrane protein YqjE
MSGLIDEGLGYGVSKLAGALRRVLDDLWSIVVEHGGELRAVWVAELRRQTRAKMLSVVLAFLVCGTVALGALSLMVTFWDTHRVLVAWLTTAGFALLAAVTWLLLRLSTGKAKL